MADPHIPTQTEHNDNMDNRFNERMDVATAAIDKSSAEVGETAEPDTTTAAAAANHDHAEIGKSSTAPTTIKSKDKFDREVHGKDDVIDVHFDGVNWCIEDQSLDKELQFTHLADAEARASELSKSTGRSVCVHGQEGELIDSFGKSAR